MKNPSHLIQQMLGIALGLSLAAEVAIAQPHTPPAENPRQFEKIEQPLPLKIGVTLAGIALIGAELWWFRFSHAQAPATAPQDQSSRG
ncbi:hypothetical protein [Almyronema epifaneia]|uniref:Uncharacterized protein n=1 Tax=Almyronema epifaneia S1 TaxID=2991925 RepID=A0ABW6IID3_9CYAN